LLIAQQTKNLLRWFVPLVQLFELLSLLQKHFTVKSLFVISADRPQSKIDIGDGQTIRQENVFENHSLLMLILPKMFLLKMI
jgi:hypothetical protein